MTREEIIHELGEWLEQMVQHGVPSHSAKRKALATAIVLLSAEAADVYKAHEEEHLEIINRIKELQYAIAKTQTIVGKVVESADAVQGEWIWRTDIPIGDGRTSAGYICSNCGKDYWHGNVFNYCPSCGAWMERREP